MITFTVSGEPLAQGRPRFSTVNGHPQAYDPEKSRDYKNYVRLVASQYKPEKLLEGPLYLEINIYRSIPKSFSEKRRKMAEAGLIRPITKPDVDNFGKIVLDSCTSILWQDDKQVVDLFVRKWYSVNPRIEISCFPVGEAD